MAVVNRYTKTVDNVYKPRSLQELMVAPQYKRQKHDELDSAISQYETALAQQDALDVHSDALKEEQAKLYGKMIAQRDKLMDEGFSQNAKSDFMRFNKEYQQALGPQGTIGKIQSAKQSFINQKDMLLENGVKMGYGAEQLGIKLDEAYKNYVDKYGQTGKVEDFEAPLPPAYVDLQKDILEMGKAMGSETLTKLKQNGYTIGTDKGLYVIKTRTGEVLETSNDPNIKSALDYLNAKWLSDDGKGAQSAKWQGLDNDTITEQINSGLQLQRKYAEIDKRQTNYQFKSIPQAQTNPNGAPMNFLNDKIQGLDGTKIDPHSPLLSLDKVENVEFTPEGRIAGGDYASYEEKVKELQDNNSYSVRYNEKTGLYEYRYFSQRENMGYGDWRPVYKDGQHLRDELDKIRAEHRGLAGLNDKELVERMQAFKENLASNYVGVTVPVGANYGWLNDRLFGNDSTSSGGKSTGTMSQTGATINGEERTYDEVLDELGWDNFKEFREEGMPSVEGFVPTLGKWRVTAFDSDGNQKDFFIDSPAEINSAVQKTQTAFKALTEGKTFAEIGEVHTPDYSGYMYIVNDFREPRIVYSPNRVSNLNELDPTSESMSFQQYAQLQVGNLKVNQYYRQISGLDKTNK